MSLLREFVYFYVLMLFATEFWLIVWTIGQGKHLQTAFTTTRQGLMLAIVAITLISCMPVYIWAKDKTP